LQNHALLHQPQPQSSSLPQFLPHAWHEIAAGVSAANFTLGLVVLGPAVVGKRGAAIST